MSPDHRSRLRRALPVAVAIVLLVVASASVAARPAGKGPTTDYLANCNVNLRSSASTSASILGTLASNGSISTTGTVSGGAWSGACPTTTVSGSTWYVITKVNGTSVKSLYGVTMVYAATGMFRTPPPAPAPTPTPTPTPNPTGRLEGIDVSKWQASVDYNQVRNSGRSFVIARASYGGLTDEWYTTNKANARAAGLAFGAYHFAYPNLNPTDALAIEEADTFVNQMGILHGMLIPALDLENCNSSLGTSGMIHWVQVWLDRVYTRTGARAMIYTSPNFWATCMGDSRWFADNGYPILWVAHWYVSAPTVPAQNWGGRSWTFWQYTDKGSVPGVSGSVDLDRFNGTSLSSVTY
jgi:GH25 family lysozyme M1 (1,4-beta-N-acetylmuramidase)